MKKIISLIMASIMSISMTVSLPSLAEGEETDNINAIDPSKKYVCTYNENEDGWEKYAFNSKGTEIYSEDSKGNSKFHKYTYYKNGNIKTIYVENYGENSIWWSKDYYNKKGYLTYSLTSDGYWQKQKYDKHGNCIFSQDNEGDGYSCNKSYTYYPNGKIKTETYKDSNDEWYKSVYDENGNEVYYEYYEDGVNRWCKYKYDSHGNETYCEWENGYTTVYEYTYYDNGKIKTEYSKSDNGWWGKSTYDEMGNLTYTVNSNGSWTKYLYDSKGNLLCENESDGEWQKNIYDSKGNRIRYFGESDEGSYWGKYTYDSHGNEIYYKNSDGNWEKSKYAKIGSKKSLKPIASIRSASAVKKDKRTACKAIKNSKVKKLSLQSKSKNIKAFWKWNKRAMGYKVTVSKDKNFNKIVYNKNLKKNVINIDGKKIKSKKTYYIKIRTYSLYRNKKGKAVKVYSKLSKIKKIKVK